jgi:hypothetical protein
MTGFNIEPRPPVERFPVGRRLSAAFVFPGSEICAQTTEQLRAYHLFNDKVAIFLEEVDLVCWKHSKSLSNSRSHQAILTHAHSRSAL